MMIQICRHSVQNSKKDHTAKLRSCPIAKNDSGQWDAQQVIAFVKRLANHHDPHMYVWIHCPKSYRSPHSKVALLHHSRGQWDVQFTK